MLLERGISDIVAGLTFASRFGIRLLNRFDVLSSHESTNNRQVPASSPPCDGIVLATSGIQCQANGSKPLQLSTFFRR
jgi:hypothetical protein